MKKTKLFGFLALGFFLLNLVLAGFLIFDNPPQKLPHREGPRKLIIEKLDFDKDQAAKFEALIPDHHTQIKANREKTAKIKKEIFKSLNNASPEMDEVLSKELVSLEVELQQLQYTHFKDIKDICRDDQLEKFDVLTKEIARLFDPQPPPHKMKRK